MNREPPDDESEKSDAAGGGSPLEDDVKNENEADDASTLDQSSEGAEAIDVTEYLANGNKRKLSSSNEIDSTVNKNLHRYENVPASNEDLSLTNRNKMFDSENKPAVSENVCATDENNSPVTENQQSTNEDQPATKRDQLPINEDLANEHNPTADEISLSANQNDLSENESFSVSTNNSVHRNFLPINENSWAMSGINQLQFNDNQAVSNQYQPPPAENNFPGNENGFVFGNELFWINSRVDVFANGNRYQFSPNFMFANENLSATYRNNLAADDGNSSSNSNFLSNQNDMLDNENFWPTNGHDFSAANSSVGAGEDIFPVNLNFVLDADNFWAPYVNPPDGNNSLANENFMFSNEPFWPIHGNEAMNVNENYLPINDNFLMGGDGPWAAIGNPNEHPSGNENFLPNKEHQVPSNEDNLADRKDNLPSTENIPSSNDNQTAPNEGNLPSDENNPPKDENNSSEDDSATRSNENYLPVNDLDCKNDKNNDA